MEKNSKVYKNNQTIWCLCYVSTYDVEILNSFNLELQLKNIEFSIEVKLNTLNELRGLK